MSLRVCRQPGCPTLIPTDAYRGFCGQHRREWDKARGSREDRGYGADHIAERERNQRLIDAGLTILCARCGQPVLPGQPWALDHTDDRTGYLGPSHKLCNDRAGGQKSHGN